MIIDKNAPYFCLNLEQTIVPTDMLISKRSKKKKIKHKHVQHQNHCYSSYTNKTDSDYINLIQAIVHHFICKNTFPVEMLLDAWLLGRRFFFLVRCAVENRSKLEFCRHFGNRLAFWCSWWCFFFIILLVEISVCAFFPRPAALLLNYLFMQSLTHRRQIVCWWSENWTETETSGHLVW